MRPSRSCAFFSVRRRAVAREAVKLAVKLQGVAQFLHRDPDFMKAIGKVQPSGVFDRERDPLGALSRAVPRLRGALRIAHARWSSLPVCAPPTPHACAISRDRSPQGAAATPRVAAAVPLQSRREAGGLPAAAHPGCPRIHRGSAAPRRAPGPAQAPASTCGPTGPASRSFARERQAAVRPEAAALRHVPGGAR